MSEERRLVHVSHAEVGGAGTTLVTLGLGSCVAIVLHDAEARVGGLAHVLLPHPGAARPADATPAKFASTAVPHLVERMESEGARRERLVARLVGGAAMFAGASGPALLQTGERNIVAAREALAEAGIPLVGEEVGKGHGRSVHFAPADGRVSVRSYRHPEVIL